MISPEVVEFPDSDKVGMLVGGRTPEGQPQLLKIYKKQQDVDYYEGE